MVEETHPPAPDGQPAEGVTNPSVRHERTDVSTPTILGVIVAAMLFAAWVHIILLVFYQAYARSEAAIKTSPYPLAPEPSSTLPPEPRLEQLNRINNVEKSNVYERQESRERVLDSYGTTGEDGYVHVPIDVAIKSLAGKLPSRGEAPADRHRQNGLVDGGESSSGRMFRKEPLWSER